MDEYRKCSEQGTILIAVVVFIALAVAGLAAISAGRVVAESGNQKALEQETRAYNDAFGKLQLAMNIVNTSAYTDETKNIELRDSINGDHGGTAGGDEESGYAWL